MKKLCRFCLLRRRRLGSRRGFRLYCRSRLLFSCRRIARGQKLPHELVVLFYQYGKLIVRDVFPIF
mgnify:CR=1 FL=1